MISDKAQELIDHYGELSFDLGCSDQGEWPEEDERVIMYTRAKAKGALIKYIEDLEQDLAECQRYLPSI